MTYKTTHISIATFKQFYYHVAMHIAAITFVCPSTRPTDYTEMADTEHCAEILMHHLHLNVERMTYNMLYRMLNSVQSPFIIFNIK